MNMKRLPHGDESLVPQLSSCGYYCVATLTVPQKQCQHTTFYTSLG